MPTKSITPPKKNKMLETIALVQESIDKKIGLSERINEMIKKGQQEELADKKLNLSPSNS